MRTTRRAGWACIGGSVLGVVIAAMPSAYGQAASQGPSDELVTAVMNYAWEMLPTQFSNKDGKVIVVDKTKRDPVMVPMEVAREVVRVGRISAHAQVCNLPEDQALNHRSLMKREIDKNQWTDQQKLWINQLHLTTVMVLTGKVKVVEKDGDKEVVVQENKGPSQTCTPEQAQKVKDVIKAYVDAGPKLAPVAPPTTTGAATPPATATPAAAAQAAPPDGKK